MAFDRDTSADELGRAFAALVYAATSGPDMGDILRALAEFRTRHLERLQDERASEPGASPSDGKSDPSTNGDDGNDRLAQDNDPAVILLRVQGMLLHQWIDLGLQWQRLLEAQLPEIRRRLAAYRSDADPYPEDRTALIDQVREFLQEVAWLASDRGRILEAEIERLQRELLPPGDSGQERRRYAKRKGELLAADTRRALG